MWIIIRFWDRSTVDQCVVIIMWSSMDLQLMIKLLQQQPQKGSHQCLAARDRALQVWCYHGSHFHRCSCLFWEMPWLHWEVGFRKQHQEQKEQHTMQPSQYHPQKFSLSSPNADQPYPKSLAHYPHSKQYATIHREAGLLAPQFRKKEWTPTKIAIFPQSGTVTVHLVSLTSFVARSKIFVLALIAFWI